MRGWKSFLWLIVFPYWGYCFAEELADLPENTTFRMSTEIGGFVQSVQAPIASESLKKNYEAGLKAARNNDLTAAMSLLKPVADSGHAPSQALLAYILDKSSFSEEAAGYYLKSAKQGNADGQFGLGVMYAEGSGVKQDLGEARRLVVSAAQQGHKQAINVVALAYIKGGLGLDEAARKGPDALAWIKRSADSNYLPSIDALAAAYASGMYGLAPDPKQADALIAKADKLRGIDAKSKKKKSQ
jgi:uncharacterized protein